MNVAPGTFQSPALGAGLKRALLEADREKRRRAVDAWVQAAVTDLAPGLRTTLHGYAQRLLDQAARPEGWKALAWQIDTADIALHIEAKLVTKSRPAWPGLGNDEPGEPD